MSVTNSDPGNGQVLADNPSDPEKIISKVINYVYSRLKLDKNIDEWTNELQARAFEERYDKKNSQYSEKDQSSSSIIKFLNSTVSKFSKKGSSQIANHLELYESTMDSLKLFSDADRIRFLPWAFDDRYRHYFTSFKERGVQDWPSVLHEVKLEFGPYRTTTAAKRDIYSLTCRPNQSPREFLSVLKNAYGLAYRSPNWESEEFKQLFYDAMPTQIKLNLARDLDIDAPLDRLVTAATTLYNISECHTTGERRFKNSPEQKVAEAKVNPNLGFESQPRRFPQSTGPSQQAQQQQVGPPKQTKPQNNNGSEGNNSGNGKSNYRPYYNNIPQGYRPYNNRVYQGYRRWDNRPRQQREDRQESLNSPRSRSPTNSQGAQQSQNVPKPNSLIIYWKKVRGHSKYPGMDKEGNDLADSLAKQAAIDGEVFDVDDLMGTIQVDAMTRSQAQKGAEANVAQWGQDSPSEDLIASQKGDPIIGLFYKYIEDPHNCPITTEDCRDKEELRILMKG
ncbi:uncharacterized protein LOC122942003 [Bufo gargarizans]|uniref:uncharacterized protein LOC122942003 n=1 Tax=Bufo gargarizans TaxID=30331 RepID=UPI001CF3F42C|nr:uncharacterized protein LOC122942003 [Bufo gargarizans]